VIITSTTVEIFIVVSRLCCS